MTEQRTLFLFSHMAGFLWGLAAAQRTVFDGVYVAIAGSVLSFACLMLMKIWNRTD